MQVTTITVTRSRKFPPEQYGGAEAIIQLSANLDDGEDWQEKGAEVLASATALVYGSLGLTLPAKLVGAAETSAKDNTAKVEAAAKSDKPKPRGRPKKSDTSDLPGVASEPDDGSTVPSEDTEAEVPASDATPMSQDDLQAALVEWIKSKNKGGVGIDVNAARLIMSELTGVIKSSDVRDEDVQAVYDAVKAKVE